MFWIVFSLLVCFCSALNAAEYELAFKPEIHAIGDYGVYISAVTGAANLDALVKEKITHVVDASGISYKHHDHISYLVISVEDDPKANIAQFFDETNTFITNAIRQNGRVLVHCHGGVSRSTTILIAFMMSYYRLPVHDALSEIKKVRPFAQPNPGFMDQLEMYMFSIQRRIVPLPNKTDL